MHLYASTHKVHSVARCILTHSRTRILTHSSAFRCIHSHTQSGRVQTSQGAGSAPRLVHAFVCNIVAGTRIQPTDDTVEEEGDEEESDEDLDDM